MDGVRVIVIAALIVVVILIVAALAVMADMGGVGAGGAGAMMGGYGGRFALALALGALALLALAGALVLGIAWLARAVARCGGTACRWRRPTTSCGAASPPGRSRARSTRRCAGRWRSRMTLMTTILIVE